MLIRAFAAFSTIEQVLAGRMLCRPALQFCNELGKACLAEPDSPLLLRLVAQSPWQDPFQRVPSCTKIPTLRIITLCISIRKYEDLLYITNVY